MTYIYMLAWVRSSHCHCQDLLVRPAPDLSGPWKLGQVAQVVRSLHLESGFAWEKDPRKLSKTDVAVCQNRIPLVNIKIAGKWMFIPLKMVLIGIDPYPCLVNCWYTDILVGGEWNHGILNDFPCVGNNHPNWRTHIFQRGWNHQLVHVCDEFGTCWHAKVWEKNSLLPWNMAVKACFRRSSQF